MIMTKKLPHLKRMRVKSIITHDPKDLRKGSLVIMNTNELVNLQNKLGPIILNQKSLMQYAYTERMVNIQIYNKRVRQNFAADRELHYNKISAELPYLKGVLEAKISQTYNVFYDLTTANKLFQENTLALSMLKKPAMYWNYIMEYMGTKFNDYKFKTMIINAEEFSADIVQALKGRSEIVNPIGYLYYIMLRDKDTFFKLGDIDIVFTNNNDSLRINPKECQSMLRRDPKFNIANAFRRELFKLLNKKDPDDNGIEADLVMSGDVKASELADRILSKYAGGATGDIPEETKEKIEKAVDKAVKKAGIDSSESSIESEIDNDAELMKALAKDTTQKPMKQTASTKRDEMLREKQLELTLRDKSVQDILKVNSEDIKIETNDISDKVETINKNVTQVRYPNINKAYIENLMEKDLTSIIMDLNNKSIPVYVRSIKVEDSSDLSNYKETYTIELEDELRRRHRLVFDVPKFIDNRFMYLGGNRKYINNQQMMLPIAKTAPDTVQLVSNYNKIFIRRYGDKVSNINEKMKKALGTPNCGAKVVLGRCDMDNKPYVTTIEYDDFAKSYKELEVDGIKLIFSQPEIRKIFANAKIKGIEEKYDSEILPLGFKGQTYYGIDLSSTEVIEIDLKGKINKTGKSLVDFILERSTKLQGVVGEQTAGKKYMYNRATIMTKQVPIVLLLAYYEGIDGLMKKANVKHYFSDTRPRVDSDETVVQFQDGFLVYSQKPYENALLMNGLLDVPTKNYNYNDFNDKFAYQSLFETMFGRRNIANAFDNFLDNFLDPITIDVCERMSLPTDLVSMVLYANKLLADNQYTPETDLTLYRIRSAEVVNAIIYKHIAKAYEKYKETSHYSNPQKISIKKDAIIKDVMMQQIIEDYSELNPIAENQKLHGCTKKGPSGCNLAQAYTEEQRSYHKSMTGVFTISSSPDGNVGVQRVLTMEPPINDPRGFINNKAMEDKLDDYNDVNLFGVAEMLTTSGAQRDDGIRTAMSTKQSTHVTPVKKSSPSLVTNGAEQALQYHLSKDWSFVAQEDGKVVELDESTGLMIVQYKSGKADAISISSRIAKNGAGGFHLSKQMVPRFKQGQSFKKNDILATDRDFFSDNDIYGNKFNIGSLQKVALLSSAMTFEDSSYITKQVSRDMASEIVMPKKAVLGPNTNVDYMVKIGDRVQSGDELLRFERSFDADGINSLLFNIGDDMQEDIAMSGKDKIKTKYTGVIEDIKIFSTVSLEELSPSLRKIVTDYYGKIREKRKLLDKYDPDNNGLMKCNMLFNEPTGKVETNNGKLRGEIVNEGVLIEFYIKIHDELGVGDKLVFFSALKSIVGTVIEEGQEAYTLYRPEEKIGAVLSCNSLISRGISSCPLMMASNKLLVELSRKLREIYES